MHAEIISRLQASFDAQSPEVPIIKANFVEQFDLYRLEAQMDAVKTQMALLDMQIRMLDDKLDQLAHQGAEKAQMLAPSEELAGARDLRRQLDVSLANLREQHRKQQAQSDEAARSERKMMESAIDRALQEELRNVHALEDKLGIPVEDRTVVQTNPKKHPASKK